MQSARESATLNKSNWMLNGRENATPGEPRESWLPDSAYANTRQTM